MKKIMMIMTTLLICACSSSDVRSWSEEQIHTWYDQSPWSSFALQPAEEMNKRLFVEQNVLNPEAWKAAMEFLSRQDLNSLPQGRIELSPEGTFATVTDYTTKSEADFEAHRKYIDIQYVASGSEYIYITPMEGIEEYTQPYDQQKDICFFSASNGTQCLASPKKLVVLFPCDGHKPCMKVTDPASVRKIVVKIPVAE